MIGPGANWKKEIDEHLRTADVIVALVSASFIESEYCSGIEMSEAISRHETLRSILIPVVVRPVLISVTPFAELQVLPPDAKPVSAWANEDEAWKAVTESVLSAALAIQARKKAILEKLGLQPVLDFYRERRRLIWSEAESTVARNIARLDAQDAALGERLRGYRAKLQDSARAMWQAIWRAYETLFSARGMNVMFARVEIDGPLNDLFALSSEELGLANALFEKKMKPEFFGLPPLSGQHVRQVRVFLASPGDVEDERAIALELIKDLPYREGLHRGRIFPYAIAWDRPWLARAKVKARRSAKVTSRSVPQ